MKQEKELGGLREHQVKGARSMAGIPDLSPSSSLGQEHSFEAQHVWLDCLHQEETHIGYV